MCWYAYRLMMKIVAGNIGTSKSGKRANNALYKITWKCLYVVIIWLPLPFAHCWAPISEWNNKWIFYYTYSHKQHTHIDRRHCSLLIADISAKDLPCRLRHPRGDDDPCKCMQTRTNTRTQSCMRKARKFKRARLATPTHAHTSTLHQRLLLRPYTRTLLPWKTVMENPWEREREREDQRAKR